MFNKLKKECIVYILIFCLNQITIAGVNPFGIAMAGAAIGNGYNIILVILATLIGNMMIYDYHLIANTIVLIIFGTFEFTIRKYSRNLSDLTKTMFFVFVFSVVRIGSQYQDLYLISILIFILEAIIVGCTYIVVGIGLNYIVKKDVFANLGLQEKISLSLIGTLFGIYIIQVRKENVTFLKIVIIYMLSFIVTVIYNIYKSLYGTKNSKFNEKGNIYNSLVYNKMIEYSEGIKNMARSIESIAENKKNINNEEGSAIFEKISEKYCALCDRCSYCWDRNFDNSYLMVNSMMQKGVENGVLTINDIPKNFMIKCRKSNEIVSETNINLELARNNIWWQSKIDEMKKIMSMQLTELSNSVRDFSINIYHNVFLDNKIKKQIKYALKQIGIITKDVCCYEYRNVKEIVISVRAYSGNVKTVDIVSEISDVLQEKYKVGEFVPKIITKKIIEINLVKEEKYNVLTSVLCRKKEGEKFSGDNYSIMDEDISDTLLVISDGMGSGKRAYEESKKAIEMVEEFFAAGFSKDVVMNLVNLSCYMNYEKSDMYSTLDICAINRYTGIAEFIKMGGTFSYIKRENEVIGIESDTLPLGVFDSTVYDRKQINLQNGDIIIMMTDGLEDSMPSYLDWKEEMIYIIKNISSTNPKTIAETILENALTDGEIIDDITILVGVVWEKDIK